MTISKTELDKILKALEEAYKLKGKKLILETKDKNNQKRIMQNDH